jgi:hypothetical protein
MNMECIDAKYEGQIQNMEGRCIIWKVYCRAQYGKNANMEGIYGTNAEYGRHRYRIWYLYSK